MNLFEGKEIIFAFYYHLYIVIGTNGTWIFLLLVIFVFFIHSWKYWSNIDLWLNKNINRYYNITIEYIFFHKI
jgi:hypothetical protein